jgi:hypothetical protein
MNEADRRSASAQISMRSRIKRFVRRAAMMAYRIARPVVRPLAYRTRSFFTVAHVAEIEALRRDVLHEIRHTHGIATSVLIQTAQSVQHELLMSGHQFRDASSRESQALVAGVHKSMQFARESVREDVFRTHASALAELRHESERIGLAVEAVAEMIRAEASSLHSAAIESDAFSRLDKSAKLASGRRAAVQCSDDVLLIKSEAGYVFCPESERATLAALLGTGDLNKGTRLVTQRLLVPGDVFVDVGANIGLDTLAAAHVLRGQGQVIAFESSASKRSLLAKSIAMNGFAGMVDVREEDLSTLSLDSIFAENHKISLITIDANSARIDVIDGACSLTAASPKIALIVKIAKSGDSFDRVISRAQSLGLVHRTINRATGELAEASMQSIGEHDSVDLVLARRESGAWSKLGVKHD